MWPAGRAVAARAPGGAGGAGRSGGAPPAGGPADRPWPFFRVAAAETLALTRMLPLSLTRTLPESRQLFPMSAVFKLVVAISESARRRGA